MAEIRRTRASSVKGHDFALIRSANAQPVDGSHDSNEAGITSGGRDLAPALSIVRSADEIREERVRSLRAQVTSGTYQPDPRQIARAILGRGF